MITVLIPAHDEEGYIGRCLDLLRASTAPQGGTDVHVIVIANGCHDATVAEARSRAGAFAAPGWQLDVIERTAPGKTGALNTGEARAGPMREGDVRVYLDADLHVAPDLLAALARTLARDDAAYSGGIAAIRPARSAFSRAYARFWMRLPFMSAGVPGNGLFAVNAAGRARWGAFPDVIADDSFVRLHFEARERHLAPARYDWPIAEGFRALVRVRRRQNRGLWALRASHPALFTTAQETAPSGTTVLRLALADPIGFLAYGAVAVAVRFSGRPPAERWARSR